MRIIAGQWRGRPIAAPQGRATRPTSDRAREGLFSMLASRVGSFEGLRIADLFAGSGALGLEALSRGAAHCSFIETDRAAIEAIRRNLGAFGAIDRAEVRTQAAEQASPPAIPFDIVMLDPPYAAGLGQAALNRVGNPAWIMPGGWLSLETAGERPIVPAGFTLDTERRFGKAHIHLLRAD